MPAIDTASVIIVEDDPSMQQALDRILRLGGLHPVVYANAERLLTDYDEARAPIAIAGCLIIDVQLPGMNGFALHDYLSSRVTLPPVIVMTAFDDPDVRAQAARIGAVAFLAKPFSGRLLLERVSEALGTAAVR